MILRKATAILLALLLAFASGGAHGLAGGAQIPLHHHAAAEAMDIGHSAVGKAVPECMSLCAVFCAALAVQAECTAFVPMRTSLSAERPPAVQDWIADTPVPPPRG